MTRSLLAVVALGIALLAGSRELCAADAMPKFDIARICKAEVGGASGIGETVASCTADEEHARNELIPRWSTFSRDNKTTCIRETTMDGNPSYVELQTCLEMNTQGNPK